MEIKLRIVGNEAKKLKQKAKSLWIRPNDYVKVLIAKDIASNTE